MLRFFVMDVTASISCGLGCLSGLKSGEAETDGPGQEKWLFIAWGVGRERIIHHLALNLVSGVEEW